MGSRKREEVDMPSGGSGAGFLRMVSAVLAIGDVDLLPGVVDLESS